MSYKILLIKLLPSNRVEDFLDGKLFMNTDNFFSRMDKKDAVRYDENEGVDESLQIKELFIADEDSNWVPIAGIISPVLFRTNDPKGMNIFCMYALRELSLGHRFDERNQAFGDVGVVITDAKKFVERFRNAALYSGRDAGQAPIKYVDKATYDGPMGPFRKFDSYSYQNEFRFALSGGDETPVVFPIGDIRDISIVCKSSEINNMIRKS